MPYPNEININANAGVNTIPIDVVYPRYNGYTFPYTNSLYADPAQTTLGGSNEYIIGKIYSVFTSLSPKYEPLYDLYDDLKYVGGGIGYYSNTILEIYQIAQVSGFFSRFKGFGARSLFHAQYDVANLRNSYPRIANVNNPQSSTGSTSVNPLSSVKNYSSDVDIIFFEYVGFGFELPGKVSQFKLENGRFKRKLKIDTFSPYNSEAVIVDFTNSQSYLDSFEWSSF